MSGTAAQLAIVVRYSSGSDVILLPSVFMAMGK